MFKIEHPFFFVAPVFFLDARVEMVVPALSALFPDSARQVLSDGGPLLGSVLLHKKLNKLVLLGRPGTFDERGIEDLLPAVQALDV